MKINISRLKDIAGDDRDLIMSLFSMFLEGYNNCLKKMDEALKESNTEISTQNWHDAVHELKGSAYNLGFAELGDFCTGAESIIEKDSMHQAIEMFETQLKEVEEFMNNY